jgi:hypothetical protein
VSGEWWAGASCARWSHPTQSGPTLRRRRKWIGFLGDADLDFVALDAGFEVVDFDFGVVAPLAVVDAESPGVPGAGDDAVFEPAAGERRAHVGAEIVDGKVASRFIEDGDHAAVDGEGLALAFEDFADFGDGREVGLGGRVGHFLVESRKSKVRGRGPGRRMVKAGRAKYNVLST